MPTTEAILYQWPKPSEANTLETMIRTLNLWKPAGEIVLNVDGGGLPIVAGGIIYLPMPKFKCIIMGWTMIGDDPAGSMVVDIWKSAYPTIPTVANTITASAKPTLTAQQINRATEVPTWTTLCYEDDILAFKVESASLHTRITLSVAVARGDLR
jgi:hypothetical protein